VSNHRWQLTWVPWKSWDLRGDLLVVLYEKGRSGDPVIRVELVEAERWVIVTLYSRNAHGGGRGMVAGAIALELAAPLGSRKVYDGGGNGERRSRHVPVRREPENCAEGRIDRAATAPWPDPERFTQ
jgi:hypothetical protein